jgi:FkbM family methyltransferase
MGNLQTDSRYFTPMLRAVRRIFENIKVGEAISTTQGLILEDLGTPLRRQTFQDVYRRKLWGGNGETKFFSGPGSRDAAAEDYVLRMSSILRAHAADVQHRLRIIDLGCGDFEIGRALLQHVPQATYIGCDIVPELIRHNASNFASNEISFRVLDIVTAPLPEGDVCLVRQVLQHLSNADIAQIIAKLNYPFVYVTEGHPVERVGPINPDKEVSFDVRFNCNTGKGRGVELSQAPFGLRTQEMFRTSASRYEILVTERVFPDKTECLSVLARSAGQEEWTQQVRPTGQIVRSAIRDQKAGSMIPNLKERYHNWRRRTFPASIADVAWRHDAVISQLAEIKANCTRFPVELFDFSANKTRYALEREYMFDELRKLDQMVLFCVNSGSEAFVVNCHDRFLSREVFVNGQQSDFDKIQLALELIKSRRNRPSVFLDVGANIGSICIPAISRSYFDRAISLEPHPLNCRLLRANVALNSLENRICVHEVAAGPIDNDEVELELSNDNWGDHRVFCTADKGSLDEENRQRIKVPSMSLDTLIHNEAAEDVVLWMDVQGYEGHVMSGAKQLLASKPPLVIEFWPYGMTRARSFDALLDSVKHYAGFYDLSRPPKLRKISELTTLCAEIGPGYLHYTDLLIVG